MKLILPKSFSKEMINYMLSQLPYESVAFLLGKKEGDTFIVDEIVKVKNASHSSVEFSVDPYDLYKVYSRNKEVVGIFHSHPGHAFPSEMDQFYMKLNPVPWLIASSITGEMKAYILKELPEEIDVILV